MGTDAETRGQGDAERQRAREGRDEGEGFYRREQRAQRGYLGGALVSLWYRREWGWVMESSALRH